jgi:hypothetical protein
MRVFLEVFVCLSFIKFLSYVPVIRSLQIYIHTYTLIPQLQNYSLLEKVPLETVSDEEMDNQSP